MTRTRPHQSSPSERYGRVAHVALALVIMLVTIIIATQQTQAQTYSVLYSFKAYRKHATKGAEPRGALLLRPAGGLYGTTTSGGAYTHGVIFKLHQKTGRLTVLHNFDGAAEGGEPFAGLVRDKMGNFYGTTFYSGVVFKLDSTGVFTVLYSFTGGADGASPNSRLVRDPVGNLYGTTYQGGDTKCRRGCGVVFKLDPTGTLTVLHSFTDADGRTPIGLVRDWHGNLYGTTVDGGDLTTCFKCGVVFKISPTGKFTVLHSFAGPEGANSNAPLIRDAKGNLYGTTMKGGAFGVGVVFKLDKTGIVTVLHSFTGGADGASPLSALVQDTDGNLYGTAFAGGLAGCQGFGCGTVFKLEKNGNYTVLHTFNGTDGYGPANVIRDSAGNLFGITYDGGPDYLGVVFKITP